MPDNFHSVTHRDHNIGNKNKLCFDWVFFYWPPTLIGWFFIRLTNIHLCTLRHTLMATISNKPQNVGLSKQLWTAIFSHCLNKWLALNKNYEAIITRNLWWKQHILCNRNPFKPSQIEVRYFVWYTYVRFGVSIEPQIPVFDKNREPVRSPSPYTLLTITCTKNIYFNAYRHFSEHISACNVGNIT